MNTEVKTKEELEKAKNRGEKEIIVVGKLAKDLYKTRKIATLSTFAIGTITAATLLTPLTGGASISIGVSAIAASTGVSISIIILASSIGITLIYTIYKDYNVEAEGDFSSKSFKLKFKKK